MKFQELKNWVDEGEGLHLEFKRKARFPEKILKEISAFANTEGGYLMIGVDDNLSIPGVLNPDEEEFVLQRAIDTLMRPVPEFHLKKVYIGKDAYVLIYHFPVSAQKPVFIRSSETTEDWKAYYRIGSQSIQASKEMRALMKMKASDKNFKFQYGDKERVLLQLLDTQERVSVDEFALAADIPKKIASRTMVLLTACSVLRIVPGEGTDFFVRA